MFDTKRAGVGPAVLLAKPIEVTTLDDKFDR